MFKNTILYEAQFISNLEPKVRKKLSKLLFTHGMLIDVLNKNSPVDIAVIARRNLTGRIVGWLGASVYYSEDGCHITLNVYVHPRFRRQGIGKSLVEKFNETHPTMVTNAYRKDRYVCVNRYDDRSRLFWKAAGYDGSVKVTQPRDGWQ